MGFAKPMGCGTGSPVRPRIGLAWPLLLAACNATATVQGLDASRGSDSGVRSDSATSDVADASADAALWRWTSTGAPVVGDERAPRLLAPLSTSVASSRRPTLRWVSPEPAAPVMVEVCRDRACSVVESSGVVSGASFRPEQLLPAGVHFWRATTVDATGVARSSFTWEFRTLARDAPADTAFGLYNDFNGDGFADLVLGNYGAARVYYGGSDGFRPASGAPVVPPDPMPTTFGGSVDATDLNGDGFSDLIVYGRIDRDGYYFMAYRGAPDGLSTSPTSAILQSSRLETLGLTVSAVGDDDRDGYGDFAASFIRLTVEGTVAVEARPEIYVFHGGARDFAAREPGLIRQSTLGVDNTYELVLWKPGHGDFDGDGASDLLLGLNDPTHPFAVRLSSAATGATAFNRPPNPDVVSGAGPFTPVAAGRCDLDGDGAADVVVPDSDGSRVDIVIRDDPSRIGRHIGVFRLTAAREWTFFAITIAVPPELGARLMEARCIPDFDGDGVGDLVVAETRYARGLFESQSVVSVVRGRAGGVGDSTTVPLAQLHPFALGANGDLDRDGRSDLVMIVRDARGAGPVRVVAYRGRPAGEPVDTGIEVPWTASSEAPLALSF